MLLSVLLIVFAYLLGSVATGILVCRWMKLSDPRQVGSNNPGATNVLRHGGKKAAALTLFGDLLKGFLPVFLGQLLGLSDIWLAWVALAAFLGHLYPVFFGFQGGKGIATAFGTYLALNPFGGFVVITTWLLVAKLLNISSLAGLTSTLAAPVYFYFLTQSIVVTAILSLITLLIYWRHRSNIKSLLQGKEGKIRSE